MDNNKSELVLNSPGAENYSAMILQQQRWSLPGNAETGPSLYLTTLVMKLQRSRF